MYNLALKYYNEKIDNESGGLAMKVFLDMIAAFTCFLIGLVCGLKIGEEKPAKFCLDCGKRLQSYELDCCSDCMFNIELDKKIRLAPKCKPESVKKDDANAQA